MAFKDEFRLENFLLDHDEVKDFYTINKIRYLPPWLLWSFRLTFTIYTIGAIILSINHSFEILEENMWWTHLTNWTLLLDALYLITITIHSAKVLFNGPKVFGRRRSRDVQIDQEGIDLESNEKTESLGKTSLPARVKLLWVLFTLVYNVNVVVVSIYWTVIGRGKSFTFYRFNAHGVIFILLLIDFNFHFIPVRVLHFIYTWIYAGIFLLFSVIYDLVTDTPVYKVLDYKQKPGVAIGLAVMCCFVGFVTQITYYFLNKLKRKMFK